MLLAWSCQDSHGRNSEFTARDFDYSESVMVVCDQHHFWVVVLCGAQTQAAAASFSPQYINSRMDEIHV